MPRILVSSDDEGDEAPLAPSGPAKTAAMHAAAPVVMSGKYGLLAAGLDSDQDSDDGGMSGNDAASRAEHEVEQPPLDQTEAEAEVAEDAPMAEVDSDVVEETLEVEYHGSDTSPAPSRSSRASTVPLARTIAVNAGVRKVFEPKVVPVLNAQNRSVVDASFMLGSSFRVSWGPGGLLSCVGGASGSHVGIRQVTISEELQRVPQKQSSYEFVLDPLLQHSTFVSAAELGERMDEDAAGNSGGGGGGGFDGLDLVPRAYLSSPEASLLTAQHIARLAEAAPDARTLFSVGYHTHLAMRLVDALWGHMGHAVGTLEESEAEYARVRAISEGELALLRRKAIQHWLRHAAETGPAFTPYPIDSAFTGLAGDEDAELQAILEALTTNDSVRAVDIALSNKDFHLAMLLAQSEAPETQRALVAEQLQAWLARGTDQHINSNRLRIYALLAGKMVWPTTKVHRRAPMSMYALDSWPRAMQLQLTFGRESTDTLVEALAAYEAVMDKALPAHPSISAAGRTPVAPLPLPRYASPSQLAVGKAAAAHVKELLDVCYSLLRFAVDLDDKAGRAAAIPESHTRSTLDQRLGWSLAVIVDGLRLERPLVGAGDMLQLHTEFATQLEAQGEWVWAAFVLQHIEDAGLRFRSVHDLLLRQRWGSVSEETIARLVNVFHIPLSLVMTAAMLFYKRAEQPRDALRCALRGGLWEDAHHLLVPEVAFDLLLSPEPSALHTLTGALDQLNAAQPQRWHHGGEVFLQYMHMDDLGDQQLIALATRIARLEASSPVARLCLSEMATAVSARLAALAASQPAAVAVALSALPLPWTYRLPRLAAVADAYLDVLDAEACA